MYCKFCGNKVDENSLFCNFCGGKLIDVEKAPEPSEGELNVAENSSDCISNLPKNSEDKTKSILNKVCFGGLIAGAIGVTIFFFIVLIGLIIYGKVYLFNGYDFTKTLSVISIVLMIIGICSFAAKLVLSSVFKIGEIPNTMVKRIIAIGLTALCIVFSIWGIADCTGSKKDSYTDYDSDVSYELSESAIISRVKNSTYVQDEIADFHSLKFYYTPDWGTVEAEKNYYDNWEVTIYGNISGYTDDYKSNFVYDKEFKATVKVTTAGYIYEVRVSRF